MLRQILDANRLIRHWQRSRPRSVAAARQLARELIALRGSNAIVTPVAIEFVGGTRDKDELTRARAYLAEFHVVDEGHILAADFVQARTLAERIPHHGRARGFADCLIRALADRLHYEIDTADVGMPRSLPRSSQRATKNSPRRGHGKHR